MSPARVTTPDGERDPRFGAGWARPILPEPSSDAPAAGGRHVWMRLCPLCRRRLVKGVPQEAVRCECGWHWS